MKKREDKLVAVLETLRDSDKFSAKEVAKRCHGLTPLFVRKTIDQLVTDGILNVDGPDNQKTFAWKSPPTPDVLETWVQRQIRGGQVTQTPLEERPREKLLRDGAGSLTNAELLAVLIRVGIRGESAIESGRKIANFFAETLPELRMQAVTELKLVSKAISKASFAQVMAGIELGRRVAEAESRRKRASFKITGSASAIQFCMDAFQELAQDGVQEEFHIVTLDTKHKPIRTHRITVGTLDASLVHPREVFRPAIRDAASAVLLVHNHPSGESTPSREDHQVTKRLMEVGKLVGIEVLDHIIVTRNGGVSLVELS